MFSYIYLNINKIDKTIYSLVSKYINYVFSSIRVLNIVALFYVGCKKSNMKHLGYTCISNDIQLTELFKINNKVNCSYYVLMYNTISTIRTQFRKGSLNTIN